MITIFVESGANWGIQVFVGFAFIAAPQATSEISTVTAGLFFAVSKTSH